jgi:hypothetical protein
MSCTHCGRHDGHWMGCRETRREHARNLVEPDFAEALCVFPGCPSPRRPRAASGPAPRYCDNPDHNAQTAQAARRKAKKENSNG